MKSSRLSEEESLEKTEVSLRIFDDLSRTRIGKKIEGKESDLIPVLRVISGPMIGEYFTLSSNSYSIGRDANCQITIKDPKISRKHCQINFLQSDSKKDIVINDLNSRNGILLNNTKVKKSAKLNSGDKLKIGSNTFGFYLKFPEEVELENYLFKLATRDSTTGLVTKAFFNSSLEFEFKRSQRYKRPMTFVIMDIDHFKNINDSYGHQMGDHVLAELGKLILRELRFEDTGIRYGGEEFAMILPETAEKDAFVLIERIRKKLEKITFKCQEEIFRVTASFGISELKEYITTTKHLIKTADKAMYHAKNTGRNKSVFASALAS